MLTPLLTVIAPLVLGNLAIPVQAEPVQTPDSTLNTCQFSIKITAGTLEGNEFYGSFSFDKDKFTGEGEEIVTTEEGLQISMYYLGRTYTASSDRNYPDYPRVTLQDGKVDLVDFWVDPRDRDIWWTGVPGWDVQLTHTDCEISD